MLLTSTCARQERVERIVQKIIRACTSVFQWCKLILEQNTLALQGWLRNLVVFVPRIRLQDLLTRTKYVVKPRPLQMMHRLTLQDQSHAA